jgi:uncharacterized protein (DUF2147 family)
MRKSIAMLFALPLLAAVSAASAQNSPIGRWKTYDEDTGKPRLIVEVYEGKGGLAAKVLDTLFQPNATCTACSGENKNKPIKGMVIMWGQKSVSGGGYEGGTVLKLANGKTYKSKAKMLDANKLEVKGCVGPICKAQVWTREN